MSEQTYTFYEEEDFPLFYLPDIRLACRVTISTHQVISLVSVNNIDHGYLTLRNREWFQMFHDNEYPYLFRIHRAVDRSDAANQLDHLIQRVQDKQDFLEKALEEMDGFDGVLTPEDLHDYIVRRDGTCPYILAEVEVWLNEDEEEQEENND